MNKTIEEMSEREFLEALMKWRSWKLMSIFAQENVRDRIAFLKNKEKN